MKLRWRIEQQQQWRLADAVLDGRQPAVDPDIANLESFERDLRVYTGRMRDRTTHLCKRLIDGIWENGTLEAPRANDERGTASGRGVATVA